MTAVLNKTGSPAERFTSRNPDDFPEVTTRAEEWRFTPLAKLRGVLAGEPSDERLSWDMALPDGVEYREAGLDDPVVAGAPEPTDRLAALAGQRAGGAALLSVAPGTVLSEPVVIELGGTGSTSTVWGRIVLDIGANAEVTVVMRHHGKAVYAGETSVLVGENAKLSLVQVHEWADGTLHNEHIGARVGRDASYRYTSISLGGEVVRTAPTVEFAGPGARAELLGVAFAGDGQHFETRLYVDHGVEHCTSDVLYKHALLGQSARTVWIGDVRIRPAAKGTQTYEMNRNLLLSEGARADSVPNLEIETGDIAGAGHASTTGRFDDLQLFYLQSRGIGADEARRLVVRGFFADVVERIGVPDLEHRIMTAIEARLGFAPADADTELETD